MKRTETFLVIRLCYPRVRIAPNNLLGMIAAMDDLLGSRRHSLDIRVDILKRGVMLSGELVEF